MLSNRKASEESYEEVFVKLSNISHYRMSNIIKVRVSAHGVWYVEHGLKMTLSVL